MRFYFSQPACFHLKILSCFFIVFSQAILLILITVYFNFSNIGNKASERLDEQTDNLIGKEALSQKEYTHPPRIIVYCLWYYRRANFPVNPVNRWLVGWSVWFNFPTGQEVAPPCSYRRTCFISFLFCALWSNSCLILS